MNAKYIHAAFDLRYLLANPGELRPSSAFHRPGRDNRKLARHNVPGSHPQYKIRPGGTVEISAHIPSSLRDATYFSP
jgi:hypothetical protein